MHLPALRATAARPSSAARPRRRLLASALLLALSAPALAGELAASAAAAVDLDRVIVEGVGDGEYAPGSSTGATRLELTPRETPQATVTVTRAQLDDFGLTSVNDALAATAGIRVERVETDRTYYTARGFDVTSFQRDGLGLPLPYGIQNGDLDTALYERIEVLRGANGLTSSTGNPSATVNFVRKRPTAQWQGSAGLTVGSWNRRRVDVDVSGPLTAEGAVRGRAVAAWESTESWLDRYERDKHVLYGVVEADLGAATQLIAGISRQKNEPESPMWGALPLYYTDGTPTDYDRSTSTAADWSHWTSTDTRAFVELTHRIGADWALRAAYNREDTRQDSQLFYVYGTPDRTTGEGLFAYPSEYSGRFTADSLDAYATGPLRLFGREHDVVLGASWAKGDNTDLSWYGNDIGTPIGRLEDFRGDYPKPAFDAFPDGADFDYRRDAVYATVRWDIADRFKLITGANRVSVSTEGQSYGEDNTVDETRTVPFAGAVFDVHRNVSLYASYGEIFAQQSETDIDDRLVGPITGRSAEAGAKGEWFGGALNATLAVFRVKQDNVAEAAGYDPVLGRTYYAGVDAESRGFEIDLAGRLTEHWQIAGGYSHLRMDGDAGSDTRAFVPRRLLKLSTVVDVPAVDGLSLGASVHWQSDIHRDAVLADGTPIEVRQDAYALVGLMARYRFAPDWTATLNLNNVTDEKYLTSLYWAQGYYAAPRNASLTLSYRF